jgi:hypothetical protein
MVELQPSKLATRVRFPPPALSFFELFSKQFARPNAPNFVRDLWIASRSSHERTLPLTPPALGRGYTRGLGRFA